MEIRTLQIAIDRDDPMAQPRQRRGQIGDNETLADTTLAAADGNQLRPRGGTRSTLNFGCELVQPVTHSGVHSWSFD
jgi:hypothetical protein